MCFSAAASFTASFLLLIIGILTARLISQRRLYYIAAIPLFFSIQQAAEGLVWLSLLGYGGTILQSFATYVFLFFAIGVWPFWIPFSLKKAEINPNKKKLLQFFSFFGGFYCITPLSRLLYYGAQASIAHCHISYDYLTTAPSNNVILFFSFTYLLIVAVSFFISSIAYMSYFA